MKTFLTVFTNLATVLIGILILIIVGIVFYTIGYTQGSYKTQNDIKRLLADHNIYVSSQAESVVPDQEDLSEGQDQQTNEPAAPKTPDWTGPELFEAVNNRRIQLGVNPLQLDLKLCTIASIRLNELLKLGELDAHDGFLVLSEREEYSYIFNNYNVYEFLLSGAQTAQEAVDLWENTLGHSKLLTGGEYVWGCTYAQNGFGVAITAF